MTLRSVILTMVLTAAGMCAADLDGKWTAAFETQIGEQKYTYEFKVNGTTVTGTAQSENGKVQITDGKLTGDTVTFVENLDFQGMPLRIVYTGKLSGDEIRFTRNVADIANEPLTAKRVK